MPLSLGELLAPASKFKTNLTVCPTGMFSALVLKLTDPEVLPAGIVSTEGDYEKGDLIKIVDQSKTFIGTGLTHFNNSEVELIKGSKSENIETISIIYTMLKKDGLTIQGAKKKLKSKDISESENLTILKKLNKIKEELRSLKNNL